MLVSLYLQMSQDEGVPIADLDIWIILGLYCEIAPRPLVFGTR